MIKHVTKATKQSLSSIKRRVARHPSIEKPAKQLFNRYLAPLRSDRREYRKWVRGHYPDLESTERLRRESKDFSYRPCISILVPTYNTDPQFLRDCIESVIDQAYENWQLCIADDASQDSEVRSIIQEYAQQDPRIEYVFLKKNHHISDATNQAAKLATGEYISLFDHDDILWPNALYEVVKQLNHDSSIDFIYTDEDKVLQNGTHHLDPFYKTDWNPTFLHSVNYITHFATIRRNLFESVGGLRSKYNGAQDWDLFLRIARATTKICHIPSIVYSWRIHDASTSKETAAKPYVIEAQRAAILDDLKQRGLSGVTDVEQDSAHPGYWNVNYAIKSKLKVSIIVVSDGAGINHLLEDIHRMTSYKNTEVIVVGDQRPSATDLHKVQWVEFKKRPSDALAALRYGATFAKGEVLVFLADKIQFLTDGWLERLVAEAQQSATGLVGPLILNSDHWHIHDSGEYPDVVPNNSKMATKGMRIDQKLTHTQHLMLFTRHGVAAKGLNGAAMRAETFRASKGTTDEELCVWLTGKGYEIIYNPQVRLALDGETKGSL